jgi:hypothetical protein
MVWGKKREELDLEDPLVHEDDGDVEALLLEDREHRADAPYQGTAAGRTAGLTRGAATSARH